MASSKEPATKPLETPQELERVREIIFGRQMREYEQRFQALQRDVERARQELERLNQQLSEQRQEAERQQQLLRTEQRQSDDELRDELRAAHERIDNDKMDRMVLGELLIELGNQLKGQNSSVSALLQGLIEAADAPQ